MRLLLCAMLVNSMVLAESVVEITVCPENYPAPKDQCVTLHQLVTKPDLIKSHTIITFVPATFTLEPNYVISIANVSNITITTSTTSQVSIACSGDNSGWFFQNVSGLTLKNINFSNCGVVWYIPNDLNITCVLGLENCANVLMDNLTFIHAKSYGVFAINVYGSLTLTNTLFRYSGTGLGLRYNEESLDEFSLTRVQPSVVTMSSSEFSENHYSASAALVIDAALYDSPLPLKLQIVDVLVTNNTKGSGISDVSFLTFSTISVHIILENFRRVGNTIIGSVRSNTLGGSDFLYVYQTDFPDSGTNIIEIVNCTFMDNVYNTGDSLDSFNIDLNLYSVLFFSTSSNKLHKVSVINSRIDNNFGKYGAALYYESINLQLTNLEIVNCTFANQSVFSSDYYKKGTVFVKGVSNFAVNNSNFIDNFGTGILIEDSYATFAGATVIQGNKAFNGGGIVLYGKSQIWFSENSTLIVMNNIAENVGGGLYANIQQEDLVSIDRTCYIAYFYDASVLFFNNSAGSAGNDIYGGDLYTCMIGFGPGWKALGRILQSPSNSTIELTSDPTHVCDCSKESTEDCMEISQTINTVWTYPGRQFNLSLLAVGLVVVNGTALSGVSTAIYATLLNENTGTIPSSMRVQSSQRMCSNITYRIDTCNDHEVMVLSVNVDGSKIKEYVNSLWLDTLKWSDRIEKLLLHNLLIPAYVEVYFHQCPTGFNLSSHGVCVCSNEIDELVDSCSIDTLQLQRKPLHWIGLFNMSKQDAVVYLTHQHCPFNYCKAGTFTFSLDEPDVQCDHHRTGILCGACKPGYSLVLGSTECRKCSNIYLSLLFLFALVGVGTIAFLTLTNMTVAAGTINGLLFYANVVTDNQATFFSPQASDSFLSTFIAWLSLNLGVTTCFYDGLDGYVYTWLQLAFPIYIWLLAYFIILAARHVAFVSKLCGSNIVPVLATLFLLSYTKLLQTIITGLSFTVVEASNGEHLFVWLKDGNGPYLQGKHIPLFIVSVVFLLVLLTYTLAIVLGPWLQRKTHLRAFNWVVTLKPLLDAYYGPLNDQYRYWTGLLLLSRIILGLISAVNALGDESINLLAIVIVSSLLLWRSSIVYKFWALSLLDSFFLFNLIVFSSVSFLNKLSSVSSQYAAVCASAGATFAVFAVILLYHCFMKMRKVCIERLRAGQQVDITDNQDSDNELLDAMDAKSE